MLEAATNLEQFSSLFQMRYAPDLLAAYLQLQHRCSPSCPSLAEKATRRLEGLAAGLGPRVLVTALRALLARGGAAPGECLGLE